jgi:hypothetical protein
MNKLILNVLSDFGKDWNFVNGPDTGVGNDYYLINSNNDEAYINVDQDYYVIEINGEQIDAGYLS